ncbi:PREDICTED: MLO-like protein 6 [Populus euphratica]|uniref:MLO-like protein n=1 Tax=Populus euphratica TaxID=75702 RepID=A0AAJ6UM75_POPEU|nr:PREDICTED: MLO-like protein 6 [Populus euphratica]XP_011031757.1 PREDICTED: MLO-like protein 6 [Populus euphratica]
MSSTNKAVSLEETPTWAVAVVCFVLVAISIVIEHLIHVVEKWLKKKHKIALVEALEKVKAELMLMGFISLFLTILQGPISDICIPKSVAATWHPCDGNQEKAKAEKSSDSKDNRRRLLQFLDSGESHRRFLASKYDTCGEGKVALVSSYGIHQLHIFIFILAIVHVLYCIITYFLGRTKMRKWKTWEDETKTLEYQYHNDPERFRFARDTSFGRRHMQLWSKSPVLLWIVCFFRQFLGSVTKVDYMTLRHGFITAHLAPGSEARFDFQKYISRSLDEDFKVVVGISPIIWFIAVLLLLTDTHGWNSHLWLPFIPLVVILSIGTKLQVIITQMGLRIQERGEVVRGAPVVQPGDDLFWFGRPRFVLFLIHLVLFQNAFQIAFFIWSVYEFSIKSCYHAHTEAIVIRITLGVIIQIVCSYVTLPLYALVTQMGSSMRPTVFNDRVAAALKNWHHTAKKQSKHGKNSESHTPMLSRPQTRSHGMSPVHLLSNHRSSTAPNSFPNSPRFSNHNNNDQWDTEANSVHDYELSESVHHGSLDVRDQVTHMQDPNSIQLPPGPGSIRTQHEINIGSARDFAFRK